MFINVVFLLRGNTIPITQVIFLTVIILLKLIAFGLFSVFIHCHSAISHFIFHVLMIGDLPSFLLLG